MTDLRERRLLDLSAAELAEHLGVHPTSIHRWERRERFPGPPPGERGTGLRRLRRTAGVGATAVAVAAQQVHGLPEGALLPAYPVRSSVMQVL